MDKEESKSYVTDFRVIAVSGMTADGREITSQEIIEMAEQYDPAYYTARVNLEHFRPIFPDSYVGGFGDVAELKAVKRKDGKYALLARIKVYANLQKIWNMNQKVFSSVEIVSKFADTGKAYLVGLAVTDSPSSLCTTRHYARQAAKEIGSYVCMDLDESENTNQKAAETTGLTALLHSFKSALEKLANKNTDNENSQNQQVDNMSSVYDNEIRKVHSRINDLSQVLDKQCALMDGVCQQFSALQKQLQDEPVSGNRQLHTGGDVELMADF